MSVLSWAQALATSGIQEIVHYPLSSRPLTTEASAACTGIHFSSGLTELLSLSLLAQTPSPFLIYDIYHAILSYLKMWYEWEISYHFLRDIFYHDPYHPIISQNLPVEFGVFFSPEMAKIAVEIPLHDKIDDKM